LKAYRDDPGAKLDAVFDILTHHLSRDNAPPLQCKYGEGDADNSNKLCAEPDHEGYRRDANEKARDLPDKIVIYSQFASLHGLIKRVSLPAI
jgi:hypothetical protein